MISTISVKDFKAVPHLETSDLMAHHKGTVTFRADKPNVIVGPNGAGKSALLSALALLTLSDQTGQSAFNSEYVESSPEKLWTKYFNRSSNWEYVYQYLPGLSHTYDNAPAFYYRPHHIPGNDEMVAAAMMTGYFEEAKAYARLTKKKSSGQQAQALFERVLRVLLGAEQVPEYVFQNWDHYPQKAFTPAQLKERDAFYREDTMKQINQLLARKKRAKDAVPMLLMDEPEQSLDALAQIRLWNAIGCADCAKLQIITATHSLYPLLYPQRFNLIEAAPGYIEQVLAASTHPSLRENNAAS